MSDYASPKQQKESRKLSVSRAAFLIHIDEIHILGTAFTPHTTPCRPATFPASPPPDCRGPPETCLPPTSPASAPLVAARAVAPSRHLAAGVPHSCPARAPRPPPHPARRRSPAPPSVRVSAPLRPPRAQHAALAVPSPAVGSANPRTPHSRPLTPPVRLRAIATSASGALRFTL